MEPRLPDRLNCLARWAAAGLRLGVSFVLVLSFGDGYLDKPIKVTRQLASRLLR